MYQEISLDKIFVLVVYYTMSTSADLDPSKSKVSGSNTSSSLDFNVYIKEWLDLEKYMLLDYNYTIVEGAERDEYRRITSIKDDSCFVGPGTENKKNCQPPCKLRKQHWHDDNMICAEERHLKSLNKSDDPGKPNIFTSADQTQYTILDSAEMIKDFFSKNKQVKVFYRILKSGTSGNIYILFSSYGTIDVRELTNELSAVVDKIFSYNNFSRIVICGHSMGCMIGLHFAKAIYNKNNKFFENKCAVIGTGPYKGYYYDDPLPNTKIFVYGIISSNDENRGRLAVDGFLYESPHFSNKKDGLEKHYKPVIIIIKKIDDENSYELLNTVEDLRFRNNDRLLESLHDFTKNYYDFFKNFKTDFNTVGGDLNITNAVIDKLMPPEVNIPFSSSQEVNTDSMSTNAQQDESVINLSDIDISETNEGQSATQPAVSTDKNDTISQAYTPTPDDIDMYEKDEPMNEEGIIDILNKKEEEKEKTQDISAAYSTDQSESATKQSDSAKDQSESANKQSESATEQSDSAKEQTEGGATYYAQLLTRLSLGGNTFKFDRNQTDFLALLVLLKLKVVGEQCEAVDKGILAKSRRLNTYIQYYKKIAESKQTNYWKIVKAVLSDLTEICGYTKKTKFKDDVTSEKIDEIEESLVKELDIKTGDKTAFLEILKTKTFTETYLPKDFKKNRVAEIKHELFGSDTSIDVKDLLAKLREKFSGLSSNAECETFFSEQYVDENKPIEEYDREYKDVCRPYLQSYLDALRADDPALLSTKTRLIAAIQDLNKQHDQHVEALRTEYNEKYKTYNIQFKAMTLVGLRSELNANVGMRKLISELSNSDGKSWSEIKKDLSHESLDFGTKLGYWVVDNASKPFWELYADVKRFKDRRDEHMNTVKDKLSYYYNINTTNYSDFLHSLSKLSTLLRNIKEDFKLDSIDEMLETLDDLKGPRNLSKGKDNEGNVTYEYAIDIFVKQIKQLREDLAKTTKEEIVTMNIETLIQDVGTILEKQACELFSTNFANFKPSEEYYKTLELTSNATEDEVRKAYTKMARKWHPDKNKKTDTTEMFKNISNAYTAILQFKKPDCNDKYSKMGLLNRYNVKIDNYLTKNFKLLFERERQTISDNITQIKKIFGELNSQFNNTWEAFCKEFTKYLKKINERIHTGRDLSFRLKCESYLNENADDATIVAGYADFERCIRENYIAKIEKDIQRFDPAYKFDYKENESLLSNLLTVSNKQQNKITDAKLSGTKFKQILDAKTQAFLDKHFKVGGSKEDFIKLIESLGSDELGVPGNVTTLLKPENLDENAVVVALKEQIIEPLKTVYNEVLTINGKATDNADKTVLQLISSIKSEVSLMQQIFKATNDTKIKFTRYNGLVTLENLKEFDAKNKEFVNKIIGNNWNEYRNKMPALLESISDLYRQINPETIVQKTCDESVFGKDVEPSPATLIPWFMDFQKCVRENYCAEFCTYDTSKTLTENLEKIKSDLEKLAPYYEGGTINFMKFLKMLSEDFEDQFNYTNVDEIVTYIEKLYKENNYNASKNLNDFILAKQQEENEWSDGIKQKRICPINWKNYNTKNFELKKNAQTLENNINQIDSYFKNDLFSDDNLTKWEKFCEKFNALLSEIHTNIHTGVDNLITQKLKCSAYLNKDSDDVAIVTGYGDFVACIENNYIAKIEKDIQRFNANYKASTSYEATDTIFTKLENVFDKQLESINAIQPNMKVKKFKQLLKSKMQEFLDTHYKVGGSKEDFLKVLNGLKVDNIFINDVSIGAAINFLTRKINENFENTFGEEEVINRYAIKLRTELAKILDEILETNNRDTSNLPLDPISLILENIKTSLREMTEIYKLIPLQIDFTEKLQIVTLKTLENVNKDIENFVKTKIINEYNGDLNEYNTEFEKLANEVGTKLNEITGESKPLKCFEVQNGGAQPINRKPYVPPSLETMVKNTHKLSDIAVIFEIYFNKNVAGTKPILTQKLLSDIYEKLDTVRAKTNKLDNFKECAARIEETEVTQENKSSIYTKLKNCAVSEKYTKIAAEYEIFKTCIRENYCSQFYKYNENETLKQNLEAVLKNLTKIEKLKPFYEGSFSDFQIFVEEFYKRHSNEGNGSNYKEMIKNLKNISESNDIEANVRQFKSNISYYLQDTNGEKILKKAEKKKVEAFSQYKNFENWNEYIDGMQRLLLTIDGLQNKTRFSKLIASCDSYLKSDAKDSEIFNGYKEFKKCIQQQYFTGNVTPYDDTKNIYTNLTSLKNKLETKDLQELQSPNADQSPGSTPRDDDFFAPDLYPEENEFSHENHIFKQKPSNNKKKLEAFNKKVESFIPNQMGDNESELDGELNGELNGSDSDNEKISEGYAGVQLQPSNYEKKRQAEIEAEQQILRASKNLVNNQNVNTPPNPPTKESNSNLPPPPTNKYSQEEIEALQARLRLKQIIENQNKQGGSRSKKTRRKIIKKSPVQKRNAKTTKKNKLRTSASNRTSVSASARS